MSALRSLLAALAVEPVLLDIGASGETPAVWDEIAACSTYIGFDPDLRDFQDVAQGRFRRALTVNEAVSDRAEDAPVPFYLTRSPYCSSRLPPDTEALEEYLFSDLFVVERETEVQTTTLDSVLERFSLPRIDWIKIDSQGTDLRLFRSINDAVQSGVLAVDLEPGLMDAYRGEDLFTETHTQMLQSGFWLSRMRVEGAARIRRATREGLARENAADVDLLGRALRTTPGWAEIRYLRGLPFLADRSATRQEYGLLWAFALLDDQPGFALDVAREYQARFGQDDVSASLREEPLRRIREAERRLRLKRSLPQRILRRLLRMAGDG